MANKVLLKKSSVAAKVPVAGDLDYGEIALNYQDGKIYYKKADNSIDSFVSSSAVTGVSSVAGNTGAVTATQLLTAINTVDGSGSGLDADLLDGRDSLYFAPDSHKYHTFNNGTYYYDSFTQTRFFRLFTENYYSDTLRYCPISSVEYFNYTNSTWEDWTSGGLGGVKNLLDGQDGTQMELDHAHRKFRFVVTKSTGWPTDVLIAMYTSWWGNAWTNIVLTVEDAATTAGPWTVKETLTFNSTNTNADYGWHAYASGNVHNGRTATRITIDIPDWVDQPGYTVKRINTISMFSNYTGDKLQPWTWNYDKNVTFYNTPYVNANQIWHAGNDGTGSGLDADLLDGLNSSVFLRNDVLNQEVQSYLTINTDNGFAVLEFEDASNVGRAHVYHATASNYLGIGVFDTAGANRKDLILNQNGTITWNNNAVWHAGNDGAASGLDADLLDGQQGSYYLDTSANAQTKTGDLTITGNLTVNGTTVTINSTTLTVDDKNLELGSIASPTDVTADGGGITLKGATDKTFNWVNATGYWTASNSISAPRLVSTIGTGNSPLIVASTTLVSNLNAEFLNGVASSSYVTLTGTQTLTNKTLTAPTITGVTSIGFAAEASDAASISTTISTNQTFFDFNLADDTNNDWWRWRFTPSGFAVFDAMTLKPSSSTKADLVVSGKVTVDSGPVLSNVTGLRVTNANGYIDIGPANTSFCHIQTDRAQFFFDKKISLNDATLSAYSTSDFTLSTNDFTNPRITIKQATGNVGIGTTAPAYKLQVNGSFAATTKSFVIDHPTKPDMKLRYGSLEGPENGVYVRGRLKGNKIELPDYWTKLVDPESITVSLTSVGKHQDLYVKSIENNTITVANSNLVAKGIDCFYVVYGERCDVDKLQVEIAK